MSGGTASDEPGDSVHVLVEFQHYVPPWAFLVRGDISTMDKGLVHFAHAPQTAKGADKKEGDTASPDK